MNAFLLAPTWCDNSGHRQTFQMTLGCKDADIVLCPGMQALQRTWGLISSDQLFQGVSSLAISWCACHSVACDACRAWGGDDKCGAIEQNVKRFFAIYDSLRVMKRKYREETFVLVKTKLPFQGQGLDSAWSNVRGEHSQYLPGVLEATQWTVRSPVSGLESTLRSVGGERAAKKVESRPWHQHEKPDVLQQ